MRNALVVIAVLFITSLAWAQAQPGDPGTPVTQNVPTQVLPGESSSGPAVAPSPTPAAKYREDERLPDGRYVGTPFGERPATQADIGAVIAACQRGEKAVSGSGRTTVRNYYTSRVVSSGKDEQARQMAKDADRDAKGDYACGGDGRIAKLLRKWHVASEGYVNDKIANSSPAVPPAPTVVPPVEPAKEERKMSTGAILAIVLPLGVVGLAGLTLGIIALCQAGGGALYRLAGALGDAAQRLQGGERMEFSAGPGRMRLRVEPANPTPPAPGLGSPVGQALVPVQFAPVTLSLGPAQPRPPAQVVQPATPPAPPAQQPAQPPAPQPARPAGGGQRQRQQPAQPAAPAQPPAQPPAPGAGAPPANP